MICTYTGQIGLSTCIPVTAFLFTSKIKKLQLTDVHCVHQKMLLKYLVMCLEAQVSLLCANTQTFLIFKEQRMPNTNNSTGNQQIPDLYSG